MKYDYERYKKAYEEWKNKEKKFKNRLTEICKDSYGFQAFDQTGYLCHRFEIENPEPKLEMFIK